MNGKLLNETKNRSVRWLRHNFFNDQFVKKDDFSVSGLLEQSSKEKQLDEYIKILVDAGKETELKKVLRLVPEEKQKLLLFIDNTENVNGKSVISSFKQAPCFSIEEPVYLSDKIEEIISAVEQHRKQDFHAIVVITSSDDWKDSEVNAKFAYIIGLIGSEKVDFICINESSSISDFAESVGAGYDVWPSS